MATISSLPAANSIDATQDYLPIDTASLSTTQKINRNTFLGLASAPVGLTDSQTLTNKILTSPTLNTPTVNNPTLSGTLSGTYTIGGTPTFPSSVVTLTGSQTLTNKTLTAPNITNATITTDSITGFTNANNGTIFGIAVSGSQFTGSNIVTSNAIVANAITNAKIASQAVLSGNLGLTSGFTGGIASYTNSGTAGGTVFWINLGGMRIAWSRNIVSNAGAWNVIDLTPVGYTSAPIVAGSNTEVTGAPPGWLEFSSKSSPANGAPEAGGFSFLSRTSTTTNAVGTGMFISIGT